MDEQLNLTRCSYISWDDLVRKRKDRKLSFLCLNARSFLRKFPELLFHLSTLKNKFTYIIITESWLTPNNDYALEIPGYLSKSLYRTGTTGGGIKIYYLEGIVAKVLEEFTVCNSLYESLVLKTNVPGVGSVTVCGIYRMPNNLVHNFLDRLTNILDRFSTNRTIITGDLNLDIASVPLQSGVLNYTNLMLSYGFKYKIDLPTYVCPSTNTFKSCLDHIWHNLDAECTVMF